MDFGISDYDREYTDTFGFPPDWRDAEDDYPHTVPDYSDREHLTDLEERWHAGHDHAIFSFGPQCVIDY